MYAEMRDMTQDPGSCVYPLQVTSQCTFASRTKGRRDVNLPQGPDAHHIPKHLGRDPGGDLMTGVKQRKLDVQKIK